MDDHEVDEASSGASETYPKQCSALRKNDHALLKGHPCKIIEMSTSKTGKHGHAKVHLVGLDVFTGKKHEDICPSTHNISAVNLKQVEYIVNAVDVDGDGVADYITVMMDDGSEKIIKYEKDERRQLPPASEVQKMLEHDGAMCTVLFAMGQEKVVGVKKPAN